MRNTISHRLCLQMLLYRPSFYLNLNGMYSREQSPSKPEADNSSHPSAILVPMYRIYRMLVWEQEHLFMVRAIQSITPCSPKGDKKGGRGS